MTTLATIMQDAAAPASARIGAAAAILDRGWGRPAQALDITQRLTIAEEFEAFLRDLNGSGTCNRPVRS